MKKAVSLPNKKIICLFIEKKFAPNIKVSSNGIETVKRNREENRRFNAFISVIVLNLMTKYQIASIKSQGKMPRAIIRLF